MTAEQNNEEVTTAAGDHPSSLRVEHVHVAALSLALAVKRGAFSIEEVENVSLCYKQLKGFLEQWQKTQGAQEQPQASC